MLLKTMTLLVVYLIHLSLVYVEHTSVQIQTGCVAITTYVYIYFDYSQIETCVHIRITSPQICNIAKKKEMRLFSFFQSSKNVKIFSNPKITTIVNSPTL